MFVARATAAVGLFALTATFTLARAATAADEQLGDVDGGTIMLRQGDALAAAGKYDDAVRRYQAAFEKLLPSIRGLPFKRDVVGKILPRAELEAAVEESFAKEVTPQEMRGDELSLRALGLAPGEFDLEETMVTMLGEEIAGYYDSEIEAMHLVRETPPAE